MPRRTAKPPSDVACRFFFPLLPAARQPHHTTLSLRTPLARYCSTTYTATVRSIYIERSQCPIGRLVGLFPRDGSLGTHRERNTWLPARRPRPATLSLFPSLTVPLLRCPWRAAYGSAGRGR